MIAVFVLFACSGLFSLLCVLAPHTEEVAASPLGMKKPTPRSFGIDPLSALPPFFATATAEMPS